MHFKSLHFYLILFHFISFQEYIAHSLKTTAQILTQFHVVIILVGSTSWINAAYLTFNFEVGHHLNVAKSHQKVRLTKSLVWLIFLYRE